MFQEKLKANEIECRPIISGNLLRQPCFSKYGNYLEYVNAEIIHLNGLYIGNNQFVNDYFSLRRRQFSQPRETQ